ncbi:hypothetical protein DPMN_171464 [Dreissena polymorpha]|uniref:Uncharacterized protein n=1 Tax=Dreissena polymorpha TaxID=45954 RepID=A0A9D4ICF4_DREPO|nr:hypothetical protein DPMN_171464 [Dreissena polymorpha]
MEFLYAITRVPTITRVRRGMMAASTHVSVLMEPQAFINARHFAQYIKTCPASATWFRNQENAAANQPVSLRPRLVASTEWDPSVDREQTYHLQLHQPVWMRCQTVTDMKECLRELRTIGA